MIISVDGVIKYECDKCLRVFTSSEDYSADQRGHYGGPSELPPSMSAPLEKKKPKIIMGMKEEQFTELLYSMYGVENA